MGGGSDLGGGGAGVVAAGGGGGGLAVGLAPTWAGGAGRRDEDGRALFSGRAAGAEAGTVAPEEPPTDNHIHRPT